MSNAVRFCIVIPSEARDLHLIPGVWKKADSSLHPDSVGIPQLGMTRSRNNQFTMEEL